MVITYLSKASGCVWCTSNRVPVKININNLIEPEALKANHFYIYSEERYPNHDNLPLADALSEQCVDFQHAA